MVNYIKESYNELKNHVSWTSWSKRRTHCHLACSFSLVLALAIWGVDTVFSKVVSQAKNGMWCVPLVDKRIKLNLTSSLKWPVWGLQDYVEQVLVPTEKVIQTEMEKNQ